MNVVFGQTSLASDRHRLKRLRTETVSEITSANGIELYPTGLLKDSALSVNTIKGIGGFIDINGMEISTVGVLHQNRLNIASSVGVAPSPTSNVAVIWQDDGTVQQDGELMVTVNNGSTTVTGALKPWNTSRSYVHEPASDVTWNGTTRVLITNTDFTAEPGTYLVEMHCSFLGNGANNCWIELVSDPSGTPTRVDGSIQGFKVGSQRITVSKSFILTVASSTTFQMAFNSDGAGTGVAIDASIAATEDDPDSVASVAVVKIA